MATGSIESANPVGDVAVVGDGANGGTLAVAGVVTGKRKRRSGQKRNKPKKPVYLTPRDEKGNPIAYPSSEGKGVQTPGFDYERMAMLKEVDFTDPLDYALWRKMYFEERAKLAARDAELILQDGKTVEERKANKDNHRLFKVMESGMSRLMDGKNGDAAADRLLEMLMKRQQARQQAATT